MNLSSAACFKCLVALSVLVSVALSTRACPAEETYPDVALAKKEMKSLYESKDLAGIEKAMRRYEKSWSEKDLAIYAYATQVGIQTLALLADQGNAEARQVRDKFAREFVLKDPGKKPVPDPIDSRLSQLLEVQVQVFRHTFRHASFPKDLQQFNEERAERVTMLLTLWSRIIRMQSEYVEFDYTQPDFKPLPLYRPPASFSGIYIHGHHPSQFRKYPKIRAEYTTYLKRRARRATGRLIYGRAKKLDKYLSRRASRIISTWYRGKPNESEIVKLIDDVISDPDQARMFKASLLEQAKLGKSALKQ